MPIRPTHSALTLSAALQAIDWTQLNRADRDLLAEFISQASGSSPATPPIPGAQGDVGNGQPSPPPPAVDLNDDQKNAGFSSQPNSWGVVRVAAFDKARQEDPFFATLPVYWGAQDTLQHFTLTDQQRDCLILNMGNARLFLGRMDDSLPASGGVARYYPEIRGADGRMHQAGQPFNDALCFCGDQTLAGSVQKGFWLADAPALLAKWKASGKVPQVV